VKETEADLRPSQEEELRRLDARGGAIFKILLFVQALRWAGADEVLRPIKGQEYVSIPLTAKEYKERSN